MSDIQSNLFGGIESIVNKVIESTPIDTTITAEIALLKNADIGEYKVTYKGDTFSAKSMDPAVIYKKGEDVYVLVPKGDFSATKVILGKAAFNDTVTYADRQTMSNQWKTRGPNWLSNQWYWRDSAGKYRTDNNERKAGIIATKLGEEALITGGAGAPPSWREYLYYRDADVNPGPNEPALTPARRNKITYPATANRPSLNSLTQVDKEFQVYSDTFEHVMISAEFETNFSMVHFSGEYGIMLECWTTNPKFGKENYPGEPERIINTLRFSFNDFNGAPYQFNQSTPQRAVFPVPKGVLKGLVRVSLFQDDGWDTDIVPIYIKSPTAPEVSFDPAKGATPVRDRNNIKVKNVDIRFCEGINLEESLFWLRIDAPRGTSVYNASGTIPANPSIPLEARLFYGSEEVTSKETCKFVWFRQKYSATSDKVDIKKDKDEYGRSWYEYGGSGWAPIDKIMKPAAEEPFFGEGASGVNQYSFADPEWHQTLNVGIEVVPWQWKYKVCCVYNPTPRSLEDKIVRSSKEVILFETELITNTSSIHDFELPLPMVSNDLLTTYLRVRNNNLPWEERIAADPQNPNNPSPTHDWWCRWWMETPSHLYEPVPHSGSPRFQKGKVSINDYLHYDAITFKAQIFGKKKPTGATQKDKIADAAQVWPWPAGPDQTLEQNEFEIANIEKTILKTDDLSLMIEWDGVTNHSYNSDGSVLLESSKGAEFSLRAILHWIDTSIMDYSIEWIAPDGVTPLKHHSTYVGGAAIGSGFAMDDSMMTDMWVGADNIVRYKIAQKYDINKAKNTYTLRVTLIDGRVFEYHKEITFVKAGQNGTQGSDWEARIWPTNDVAEIVGGVGFERYTEEIRMYPRPLVVNGNFDGAGTLKRNDQFQLFLRPFIYKNGRRIEELADKDEYSYKVYWDSRYPDVKNPALTDRFLASKGSFLKFNKFNGKAATFYDGKAPGTTVPANIPDIQAFTASTDTIGGAPTAARTYGSLEVQWRDLNTCGKGATISGVKYDFTIRAQVDIYQHDKLISTIFSYWPVDILFTNGTPVTKATFDPNQIKTNWPQFVLYNATGYSPETNQDHLRFFYGKKAWNENDPLPFTATPINLTPIIQNIKQETTKDLKSWRLYPRPYYFFEECANGAMRTDLTLNTGDIGWSNPNPDMAGWQPCTYVRPVVYMINSYGNTDINGWDGKSIDLNDEKGTLFAPTIGAGYKDPYSNKFSGVVMGIDSSQKKNIYDKDIFGGFTREDIAKNPYMTGLYGYQNGVSSFGILENGTAFFGRADRGGRIIIDGYNAQIYGGLQATAPGTNAGGVRDMDMHNRMRLSFIDFEGISYDEGIGQTDNRNSLETDGIRVNTGSWNVSKFNGYFSPDPGFTSILGRVAGYGSGRGSGTPAIEIGSYKNYIDSAPGAKGQDIIKNITPADSQKLSNEIKELEIPGYRKFLVTYDGTLYAMNAFIKGNIVGSNIIATNFYNDNGSFGADEHGDLWSGSGKGEFKEFFMQDFGQWSIRPPAADPIPASVGDILKSGNPLWTAGGVNMVSGNCYDSLAMARGGNKYKGPPFFVANDGRVFCQEIHISGSSSINIGGFHVVGKDSGLSRQGDVFSFGTMYLVGPGSEPRYGPALEAWGDFYLRGKLTNLGQVFLGSSTEKIIDDGNIKDRNWANSFNSPFSITPTPGRLSIDSKPRFPVRMSAWPLFFYSGEGALDATKNAAWVTMPNAENYTRAFGKRAATDFLDGVGGAESTLLDNISWRVDQLGMWTDGLIFTEKMRGDETPTNFKEDGLLFQGWWHSKSKEGPTKIRSFVIKNVNSGSPSMVFETVNHVHISAGRNEVLRGAGGGVTLPNKVIIESFEDYGTHGRDKHGPLLALVSGGGTSVNLSDSASLTANVISLTARDETRATNTNQGDLLSFIFINGIAFNDGNKLTDEKNNTIDVLPDKGHAGTAEPTKGRIWIKGIGVAIDGAVAQGTGPQGVATNGAVSCVRINRSWNGSKGSEDGEMAVGSIAESSVNIRGNDISIRGNDSRYSMHGGRGDVHIWNIGGDNAINSNEVYLDAPGKALRMSGGEILSIGIACPSHATPGYGMELKRDRISILGYTPEQQFGIYARFG